MTPLPLPYQDRNPDVWLLDNTALVQHPKMPNREGADANVWPTSVLRSGGLVQSNRSTLDCQGARALTGAPEAGVPMPGPSLAGDGEMAHCHALLSLPTVKAGGFSE